MLKLSDYKISIGNPIPYRMINSVPKEYTHNCPVCKRLHNYSNQIYYIVTDSHNIAKKKYWTTFWADKVCSLECANMLVLQELK